MVNETLHITCPIQTKGNYARNKVIGALSSSQQSSAAPMPALPSRTSDDINNEDLKFVLNIKSESAINNSVSEHQGNVATGTPSQDATRLPAAVPSMPGTSLNIVHSTFSNVTPTTQTMTGIKIDVSEELQVLRVGRGALLCNAITSKADLEEAVYAWVYDEDATRAECGDINDWDISVSTENYSDFYPPTPIEHTFFFPNRYASMCMHVLKTALGPRSDKSVVLTLLVDVCATW